MSTLEYINSFFIANSFNFEKVNFLLYITFAFVKKCFCYYLIVCHVNYIVTNPLNVTFDCDESKDC